MGASSSKEMDAVDLEEEGRRPYQRRESGEVLRSDRAHEPDPFDDVTPTRSLAEVGLADMDEDLPTRMQSLDEVARFREAAAGQTRTVEPAKPYAKVAFKSFPAPVPTIEKPAAEPSVGAAAPAEVAIEVPIDIEEPADPAIGESPQTISAAPNAVVPSQRAFVAISCVLLVAALAVLLSDHFR